MIIENSNSISKPVVSIIILCYNQEEYIAQTIESCLSQQTTFEYEIIIGEDCGKDDTKNICIDYQKKHPNKIRLLLQDHNLGVVKNFYSALELAKGEFIAICGGDDYWTDSFKIEKQVSFLKENNSFGMIHTGVMVLDVKDGRKFRLTQSKNLDTYNDIKNIFTANQIVASTSLFHKKYVSELESLGIIEKNFLMEDYPLWCYISIKSKIGYLDETTVVWRKHSNSLSNFISEKKEYIFKFSVFKSQVYFFSLFKEIEFTKSFLIKKAIEFLKDAHVFKEKDVASFSYTFLKKNSTLSLKLRVYYLLAKYPYLNSIKYKLKNILKKHE